MVSECPGDRPFRPAERGSGPFSPGSVRRHIRCGSLRQPASEGSRPQPFEALRWSGSGARRDTEPSALTPMRGSLCTQTRFLARQGWGGEVECPTAGDLWGLRGPGEQIRRAKSRLRPARCSGRAPRSSARRTAPTQAAGPARRRGLRGAGRKRKERNGGKNLHRETNKSLPGCLVTNPPQSRWMRRRIGLRAGPGRRSGSRSPRGMSGR